MPHASVSPSSGGQHVDTQRLDLLDDGVVRVLGELTHVLDAYMSPGSVTERLHFFAAPYTPADRTGADGGLEEDGADIEVLEVPFAEALAMTRDGRIVDGKTIMLLQWAALDGPFTAGPAGPSRR